jgi:hypothetical protein
LILFDKEHETLYEISHLGPAGPHNESTAWSSVFLAKKIVPQLVKEFPAFSGDNVYYLAHKHPKRILS